jgi:DNA-binding NarL/FixJ family response regulator
MSHSYDRRWSLAKYPTIALVSQSSTTEEAVQQALDSYPDLLLMDIVFTGQMSGVEAVERLRLRGHMAVVSVTPYADKTPVRRAKVTAPFGCLLRPFDANG